MIASPFLAVMLSALFVGTGLLAVAVLGSAWKVYGRELLAIRRQLAGTDELRDFAVRVSLTETREFTPATRRAALKLTAPRRLRSQPALRAAA